MPKFEPVPSSFGNLKDKVVVLTGESTLLLDLFSLGLLTMIAEFLQAAHTELERLSYATFTVSGHMCSSETSMRRPVRLSWTN